MINTSILSRTAWWPFRALIFFDGYYRYCAYYGYLAGGLIQHSCFMFHIAERIAHCLGSYSERPCALASMFSFFFLNNSRMDANKTDVQLIPSHPTKNACSSGFLAFLQHLPDQSYCTCLLSSHYLPGRSAAAHGAIFGAEMSFLFPTSVSSRWHLRRNEDTSKHTNHSSGPALGRILGAATSHWFDPTRCKVREKIFSWPAFYD